MPHNYWFFNFISQLRLWNLQSQKCQWQVKAHDGHVWSIAAAADGESFYTVGNDKTIKRWSLETLESEEKEDLPEDTWLSEVSINNMM